jgi:hypothetical protein
VPTALPTNSARLRTRWRRIWLPKRTKFWTHRGSIVKANSRIPHRLSADSSLLLPSQPQWRSFPSKIRRAVKVYKTGSTVRGEKGRCRISMLCAVGKRQLIVLSTQHHCW